MFERLKGKIGHYSQAKLVRNVEFLLTHTPVYHLFIIYIYNIYIYIFAR